jgi:KipI family sensor histidine kinase inhibitor
MAKHGTGQPSAAPDWRWVGERGVRVATGAATLARYDALMACNFPEIEDMIPADDSILLVLRRGAALPPALCEALHAPLPGVVVCGGALHEIAVAYGGVAGPDLSVLARQAGLALDDYVDRHAAVLYTVAFLGFQPGFPYLRDLPAALHARRRASPRLRVPAGSVAVGGAYTGIYPAAGPGGWRLIGRTDAALFDAAREAPALLRPGDRVRFVPR